MSLDERVSKGLGAWRATGHRGWSIITKMIINLEETRIRTLDQVRAVLDGIQTLDVTLAENRYARCA